MQKLQAEKLYRIYLYKHPLPINCYPTPLNLCKVHILEFSIPLNSQQLSDSQKKMCFSTSQIKYRFWEIKRKSQQNMAVLITNELKSVKLWDKKFIMSSNLRSVFNMLSSPRSRLQVSIIAHCHWTWELIFLSVIVAPL